MKTDRKAELTWFHTLATTSVVIMGREPVRKDVKAYLAHEETYKCNFINSNVFVDFRC